MEPEKSWNSLFVVKFRLLIRHLLIRALWLNESNCRHKGYKNPIFLNAITYWDIIYLFRIISIIKLLLVIFIFITFHFFYIIYVNIFCWLFILSNHIYLLLNFLIREFRNGILIYCLRIYLICKNKVRIEVNV